MSNIICHRLETIDGAAVEGEDYEPVNEILRFSPHEREKEVSHTHTHTQYLKMKRIALVFVPEVCLHFILDWRNNSG